MLAALLAALALGVGRSGAVDPPPTISISNVSQNEGDSGTSTFSFTVSLDVADPANATTFDYTTLDGSATVADSDYVMASGTGMIAASATSTTIDVTVNGDTTVEPNETFSVSVTNISSNVTPSSLTGTGTILNDDVPPPTLSINNVSKNEGNSGTTPFTFTVTRSGDTSGTSTVHWATAEVPGSATAGTDYTAGFGDLTFGTGVTTQTLTVDVIGDTTTEPNETFAVNLSSPSGATIADGSGTGTIQNDDAQPTLAIDNVSQNEGNFGTTSFTFTVTMTGTSSSTVGVHWATADGTATAPSDYGAASGNLSFTPGGVVMQQVTVLVNGDTTNESNETFTVNLSLATNATISDSSGLGTILNDDGAPGLSINNVSQNEGNSGTTVFTFTVTLSPSSGQPVTVNYATADGTATAPGDYASKTGALTFNPGDTTKTIAVNVVGDTTNEPDELFNVNLSGATNATITDGNGIGTIVDDDGAPTLSLSPANVSHNEGNLGTTAYQYTVTLSPSSGQTVTVDWATSDGSATLADNDYVQAGGTLSFTPGQTTKTITVFANGDTKAESTETFNVNLSNPSNATISAGAASGTATITNDDAAPTLNIVDKSQNEGNSGQTAMSFTINVTGGTSSQPITVQYSTVDGSATSSGPNADYQSVQNGTVTIPASATSGTATVQINGDTLAEGAETFTVTLSSPSSNAIIGDGQATGTILNDDAAPTISIGNPAPVNEGNSGLTPVSFPVTLSSASGQDVSVRYSTADGTAKAGAPENDYLAATNVILTIPAGATSGTITINVVGDAKFEPDETFSVTLSSPSGATLGTASATATIKNDDQAGLSIGDPAPLAEGDSGTKVLTFFVTVAPVLAANQTINFSYQTADETATAGTDYVAKSGTGSIPGGQSSAQIQITINGDTTYEPDETFTVKISNVTVTGGGSVGVTDDTARGTIKNDDNPPLSINDVALNEGNAGTTDFGFTVSVATATTKDITFSYATADGSATVADNDYVAKNGTGTIQAGQTSTEIHIVVNGDSKIENDETFLVKLSNVTNATLARDTGTGTIRTDDGLPPQGGGGGTPSLSVSDVNLPEGNSGTTAFTFIVSLSAASTQTVTVQYATADGSAQAGSDYVAASGTLTIPAGQRSASIAVTVNGDRAYEGDEVFSVKLSNPTNATLQRGQATGTIRNDDSFPAVSIGDARTTEGNSGTKQLVFTVKLSSPSNVGSVAWQTADGTATSTGKAPDYKAAQGTLTFKPGDTSATISITINGDKTIEPSETFFVFLSSPQNLSLVDPQAQGTIEDDDAPFKPVSTTTNDKVALVAIGLSKTGVATLKTKCFTTAKGTCHIHAILQLATKPASTIGRSPNVNIKRNTIGVIKLKLTAKAMKLLQNRRRLLVRLKYVGKDDAGKAIATTINVTLLAKARPVGSSITVGVPGTG